MHPRNPFHGPLDFSTMDELRSMFVITSLVDDARRYVAQYFINTANTPACATGSEEMGTLTGCTLMRHDL